ncbi:hypothetical protein niasHT_005936 [Heterodera trifolii]|uniref:hydroxyethylthiazole kinase n=1 Tax=Heterodera trifolii TaxID=157864 RepID=A0ABD2LT56_9BILA
MSYSPRQIYALLSELRQRAPLVHCLTNQVASNFTANVLLAIGAVPAMVVTVCHKHKVRSFTAHSDALSVNLGTLTSAQKDAIKAAVQSAVEADIPWVLDPVAVGQALPFRSQFAVELVPFLSY